MIATVVVLETYGQNTLVFICTTTCYFCHSCLLRVSWLINLAVLKTETKRSKENHVIIYPIHSPDRVVVASSMWHLEKR